MRRVMLAVAMAVIAGCGGPSKEQKAAESEAAKYKAASQDASNQITALEQKNQALQTQVGDLQKQNGDLQNQLSSANAAKADLEAKQGQLAQAHQELQGQQTVKLKEPLLFQENSAKITPEAKRSLDSMADALKGVQGKRILVVGFTDNSEGGKGATAKRWQLSSNRALEVAKYIVGRGVDPAVVGVAGFGEGRPAAANDTLANKALNRRVEIALTAADASIGTMDITPAQLQK